MSYAEDFPEEFKKIKKMSNAEISRHAGVSQRNNHYCKDCFCCACLDELKRRQKKAKSVLL